MRPALLAILLLLAAAGCSRTEVEPDSEAGPAPGITADEIVSRYVEGLGGREALRAVETMVLSGTHEFVGHVAAMTIVKRRPDSFWFELATPGDDPLRARQGSDGVTAWQWLSFPTPAWGRMSGRDAEAFHEEWADFDGPLVDYAEKGHRVELVGVTTLEAVEAYEVKLVLASGHEQRCYFRAEDFTLVRKIVNQHRYEEGRTDRVYFYESYSDVGDIRVPMYIEREDGGEHVWTYSIAEVDLNAPVEESLFAAPESGVEKEAPFGVFLQAPPL